MKNYLLLWFDSLGAAYAGAQRSAELPGSRILELFAFGKKAQLFLELGAPLETNFLDKLDKKPIQWKLLTQLSPQVLEAYLSLANPPLQNNLLVVESDFLGDLMEVCQSGLQLGLSILDLRLVRDHGGRSYAFFTGTEANLRKLQAQISGQQSELILNLSEGLKEFFPV